MNTELHGNEEKQRNKEEALATDEHGKRIEKTGINYSHREDAKIAKEDKKSELAYCFLASLASLR